MTKSLSLDAHVVDALMRDLVGHDRSPAAFVVYLWLWRKTLGTGASSVGASLQTLAHATGLSKSAVQAAIRRLTQRRLIEATRTGPTLAPIYRVLAPWRGGSERQAVQGQLVTSSGQTLRLGEPV